MECCLQPPNHLRGNDQRQELVQNELSSSTDVKQTLNLANFLSQTFSFFLPEQHNSDCLNEYIRKVIDICILLIYLKD